MLRETVWRSCTRARKRFVLSFLYRIDRGFCNGILFGCVDVAIFKKHKCSAQRKRDGNDNDEMFKKVPKATIYLCFFFLQLFFLSRRIFSSSLSLDVIFTKNSPSSRYTYNFLRKYGDLFHFFYGVVVCYGSLREVC